MLTVVIWILDINLLSQIVDAINPTAKMCSDKAIFGLFPAENSFLFINPKIDPFDYHFFIRQRDGHDEKINPTTVSAGFKEFGFNESTRFNELVFDLKYFLLHKKIWI